MFFKKLTVDLRLHNKKSYKASKKMFETENRVCFVQACGTGKSYVIMQFLDDYKEVNKLLVAPSHEILNQFKDNNQIEIQKTIFITYQKLLSLYNRDEMNELGSLEFICLDEMHRAGAPRWELAVKELLSLNPNAKLLGATATPIRSMDSKDMTKELFNGNCSYELTLVDAMIQRILPVPKYISALYDIEEDISDKEIKLNTVENPDEKVYQLLDDLKNLKIELCSTLSIDTILKEHLSKTIEQNNGAKILVFCNDVNSLKASEIKINKWFSDAFDLPVEISSYYCKNKNGYKNFEKFKNSKKENSIKLLLSIGKLNEGVHIDDIDSIIMLRKTGSNIIYHQQLGRVLSISGSKKPTVFDLVNNYNNVGNSINLFKELKECLEKSNKSKNKKEQDIVIDFHDYTHDAVNTFKKINERLSNFWTSKEDSILINNIDMPTRELLILLPKRTTHAISIRKIFLGIAKIKNKPWSKEEDDILFNNRMKSNSELSNSFLNRTTNSISVRKAKLGIVEHFWTKEEDDIIKQNENKTNEELSILLPKRTIGSIKTRRQSFKLFTDKPREKYTKKEDDILIKNKDKTYNELFILLPNRNKASIKSRKRSLKLNSPNPLKYTEEEDKTIIENKDKTDKEISEILINRTEQSVSQRRRLIGLKKSDYIYFTEEEDNIIKENYGNMPTKKLPSLLPGRNLQSIKSRITKLSLSKKI